MRHNAHQRFQLFVQLLQAFAFHFQLPGSFFQFPFFTVVVHGKINGDADQKRQGDCGKGTELKQALGFAQLEINGVFGVLNVLFLAFLLL